MLTTHCFLRLQCQAIWARSCNLVLVASRGDYLLSGDPAQNRRKKCEISWELDDCHAHGAAGKEETKCSLLLDLL